jgi:hypothetical protein
MVGAVHRRIHDCNRPLVKRPASNLDRSSANSHAMRNLSEDACSAGISNPTISDRNGELTRERQRRGRDGVNKVYMACSSLR